MFLDPIVFSAKLQLPLPLPLIAPLQLSTPSETITLPVIAVGELVVFDGTALKLTVKPCPVRVVVNACPVIDAVVLPLFTVMAAEFVFPLVVSLSTFAVAVLEPAPNAWYVAVACTNVPLLARVASLAVNCPLAAERTPQFTGKGNPALAFIPKNSLRLATAESAPVES